ncbi:hypothetical protein D3C71_1857350 [compost metagenome]
MPPEKPAQSPLIAMSKQVSTPGGYGQVEVSVWGQYNLEPTWPTFKDVAFTVKVPETGKAPSTPVPAQGAKVAVSKHSIRPSSALV